MKKRTKEEAIRHYAKCKILYLQDLKHYIEKGNATHAAHYGRLLVKIAKLVTKKENEKAGI